MARRPRITLAEFAELTGSLLGLRVSRPWRGHGSAVFLELGPLRRDSDLKGHRGIATIMIEWSWRVERARSIAVGSWSTDRRIDAGVRGLAGLRTTVVTAEGHLPELAVGLSNRTTLRSFMTAEGQPAWTVFLPDGSWITVERGVLVHDSGNAGRAAHSV